MTNGEKWKARIKIIDDLNDHIAISKAANEPRMCAYDDFSCELCLLDGWCRLHLADKVRRIWLDAEC